MAQSEYDNMNLNHCIIAGNLTADPELRYTPKGVAVVSGQIAVNRKWESEDGQKSEEVSFIPYVAFGKTAENIAKFTAKGLNECFIGRIKMEQWDDKTTGQKRSRLVLVVEQANFIQFKDSPNGPGKRQDAPSRALRPLTGPESRPGESEPPTGDDAPF